MIWATGPRLTCSTRRDKMVKVQETIQASFWEFPELHTNSIHFLHFGFSQNLNTTLIILEIEFGSVYNDFIFEFLSPKNKLIYRQTFSLLPNLLVHRQNFKTNTKIVFSVSKLGYDLVFVKSEKKKKPNKENIETDTNTIRSIFKNK